MKFTSLLTSSSLAVLFALGATRPAHATGLAACGNINVEANAQCEVEPPSVSCEANCTPLKFQAACAGKLEVDCSGQCNVDISASCTASCQADCQADCDVRPATFDCKAECNLQADAECNAQCSAAANKAQCQASCKASFTAECDASCKATPPSAMCKAKCEASCQGSCQAKANASCQINCQTKAFASCEAELQGHCNLDCQSMEGALLCDGQYVDHGGNLKKCIDAINNVVTVKVRGTSQGSCSGNTCEGSAEGSAEASCSVVPGLGASTPGAGAYGVLVAGLVGLAARRRSSKRV